MEPALKAFMILALLSGSAFAQYNFSPGAAWGLAILMLLVITPAIATITSIILSVIAIALWRKEKEGSLKKRLADFSVQVAIINAFWAIASVCFVGYFIMLNDWSGLAGGIFILASLPTAVYICRKYYAKTSSWKSLLAAFLFSPLLAIVIVVLTYLLIILLVH